MARHRPINRKRAGTKVLIQSTENKDVERTVTRTAKEQKEGWPPAVKEPRTHRESTTMGAATRVHAAGFA